MAVASGSSSASPSELASWTFESLFRSHYVGRVGLEPATGGL